MTIVSDENHRKDAEDVLTGIRPSYTLAATVIRNEVIHGCASKE
jgi:hypothetical protein